MKLLQHFYNLGVVCVTKSTEEEARSFLRENPDLKYNTR